MAELRYQWGDGEVQDCPAPTKATTVALWVADREVWQGDVTTELQEWARWCALQVADLWDAPLVVRCWLEMGDISQREEACRAARAATCVSRTSQAARRAAFRIAKCPNDAASAAAFASHAANVAAGNSNATEARAAQSAHLRTLLLRRALLEERWPLIDGDERVLCDALLEASP